MATLATGPQMKKRKPDPYLVQKILTATPEELIVYIYDVAIAACGRKDKIKASEAIQQLISALRYDHKDIASNFYNTYSYILDEVHKENYEDAGEMLKEIRSTWKKAMKLD